jgi:hypothetical protein
MRLGKTKLKQIKTKLKQMRLAGQAPKHRPQRFHCEKPVPTELVYVNQALSSLGCTGLYIYSD